jgi:hypothetical protein
MIVSWLEQTFTLNSPFSVHFFVLLSSLPMNLFWFPGGLVIRFSALCFFRLLWIDLCVLQIKVL